MGTLLLAVVLFLLAAEKLAWFVVDPILFGVLLLATALVLLIEGLPVVRSRFSK